MTFTPDNLEYFNKPDGTSALSQLNLSGFIQRVNNFLNEEKLKIAINNNSNLIEKYKNDITGAKEWLAENPVYPRQEFYDLLKKENEIVQKEVAKMGKNTDYKSPFKSKILESLNQKQQKIQTMQESKDKTQDIAI